MRCLDLSIRALFALGALIGAYPSAASASEMSAEQAVALALQHADQQQLEQAARDLARSAVIEAQALPNPVLRYQREDLRSGAADESALTVVQALELGGSRRLRKQAASVGVERAETDIGASRWTLRQNVLASFHAAVAAQERALALSVQDDRLHRLARIADDRRQAGDLSGLDARLIGLAADEAAMTLRRHQVALLAARQDLAALVGEDSQHSTLVPDPLPASAALPEASSTPMLSHPELTARRQQVAQAEAMAVAAQRMRIPVELGLGYKRIDGPLSEDSALLLEIGVPIPLFDRNQAEAVQRQSELDRARAELAIAERRHLAEFTALRTQIAERITAARHYSERLIPEVNELSALAMRSFQAGETPLIELLETLATEARVIELGIDSKLQAQLVLLSLSAYTQPSE